MPAFARILKVYEAGKWASFNSKVHFFLDHTIIIISLQVHALERPWVCDLCNRDFPVRNHLERHMLTHSGQKPFTCQMCGKSYSQKTALREHEKTHTGQRDWVCCLIILN